LITANEAGQQFILFLWWAFLLSLTLYFIKRGMKNTGLRKVHIIHHNTEEAQNYIDEEAAKNNGYVNGVPAPIPVPPEAYPED